MGFFNQILVKESSTDKLIDITDLDKDHYEAFLDVVNRLQIAYQVAVRRQNISTSEKDLRVCEVMPRFDSPKNWTVDYKQENGNYTCMCCRCKEYFFGNKHRVLCRECADQLVDDSL